MSYQIAIDGPAGAGKSTVAKAVAQKLNFIYVDTGAMYRALGLYCMNNGVDINDEKSVVDLCENADVSISYIDGAQAVFLNGENVNGLIRTPEIGNAASTISQYGAVREKLVFLQRQLGEKENVVMDGRDIASVVLPNADVKIYLDADVEVRAKRRYDELVAKGEKPSLDQITMEVIMRDKRDMERENSPLTKVDDAILLNSSYLTIEEVTRFIVNELERVKLSK